MRCNIWFICGGVILLSCCLLIGVDKMWIQWHTIIFEFEVGYLFQGSVKVTFWWIVMRVIIFQVILGVAILWYLHRSDQKRKNFCLMLCLIFSCQGSQFFSWYQILFHQFSFQSLFQVLIVMLQFFHLLWCWH